jgi:hypothetical protein
VGDQALVNRPGRSTLAQSGAWIACGWRLIRQQPPRWFGTAALYLVFACLLHAIPFLGELLLILATPVLLAGLLWDQAHASHAAAPAPWTEAWLRRPLRELRGIFRHPQQAFAAVWLGIITLGLAVLVRIAGDLLIGGSMISALAASRLQTPPLATSLGMLLVAGLYLALAMGLFYSVPLTVLAGHAPLTALGASVRLCWQHGFALATFAAPFFAIYLVIVVAFASSVAWGYGLLATAGWFALPLFVASAYCSYLALSSARHPPHAP